MLEFIAHFLISGATLMVASHFVSGFKVESYGYAVVAAGVLSLVNAVIKPIMILLTLPLTIVTLGLFIFVVNALMLMLVGALTPGISVRGFGSAFIASLILTLCNVLISILLK
jgi:putative membrane protein